MFIPNTMPKHMDNRFAVLGSRTVKYILLVSSEWTGYSMPPRAIERVGGSISQGNVPHIQPREFL